MIQKRNQAGFTLLEMIIVIAVLGILGGILIPSMTQMTTKTKIITDIRSIQIIQRQLELYRTEHRNLYPTIEQDKEERPGDAEEVVKGLMERNYVDLKNPAAESISQQLGLQLNVSIKWDEEEDNLAIGRVKEGSNTQAQYINNMLEGLSEGTHKQWINVSN